MISDRSIIRGTKSNHVRILLKKRITAATALTIAPRQSLIQEAVRRITESNKGLREHHRDPAETDPGIGTTDQGQPGHQLEQHGGQHG